MIKQPRTSLQRAPRLLAWLGLGLCMPLLTQAAPGDNLKAGETVYQANCAACHDAGVAGAPKPGNPGDWKARVSGGINGVYGNAIKGKGGMPPKGGNAKLSEAEVKAAVDYMLAQGQQSTTPATAATGPKNGLKIQMPPETARYKPGHGADLANKYCMTCHSADYVATQPRFTNRKTWHHIVYKMKYKYGATLTDAEVNRVTDYLVQYYGDRDQPRE